MLNSPALQFIICNKSVFLDVASNTDFQIQDIPVLKCSVILICKPPTEMMSHFNYCFGLMGFH